MNESEIVDEKTEERVENQDEPNESLDEVKEQLIRLAADFDNYRKRVAKNIEQDRVRIKGRIINPFLDILDTMKAAKNAKYNEINDVLEGLKTLNKQIEIVMENHGVVKIEGKGNDFDSRLHEAVDAIENDEWESEKIVEIIREGYLLDGEVLRTAKVIVSKRKERNE
ncbi:MAG: nucleotide exchange factor GrpE [Marine Group III euryarchaeote CG-Bathy1]|uniref:Protein GrpE n=1 Tax=Marine Group III euryarchaeote CG-Bathy1 TaxID=1889001 RepID=A0A1J5U2S1_9ARCH|nr:MAG: nucleotide exchange factor GrpE [Marine Group III euryarchaeote CG-Bathy1]